MILRFLSIILASIWFSLEVMEDFLLSKIVSSSSLDSALTNIGTWCGDEFECCWMVTFGSNLASSMITTNTDTNSHQMDRLFKLYQSTADAAIGMMKEDSFLLCLSCFETWHDSQESLWPSAGCPAGHWFYWFNIWTGPRAKTAACNFSIELCDRTKWCRITEHNCELNNTATGSRQAASSIFGSASAIVQKWKVTNKAKTSFQSQMHINLQSQLRCHHTICFVTNVYLENKTS